MSGRKKSLSSKLSRRDPTDDELDTSLAELHAAHDRVAAIIGAALVENSLVEAIKVCLEDDTNVGKLFYEDKSPFGTFYARIIAAQAFGLVSERLAQDLDVVRDVRNQFAHAVLSLDFENEHIAAECEKLKRFPNWKAGSKRAISDSRRYYQNACYALTIALLQASSDRQQKKIENLQRQIRELRGQELSSLHPDNALGGLAKIVAAYSGLPLYGLITTSLKDGEKNVPDDEGAAKL